MPLVIIFFLIVVVVGIMVTLGNMKRNAKAFDVFTSLAAKYRGQVPSLSKYTSPTLTFPVNGQKARVFFALMHKAIGQQIGANCLVFFMSAEQLKRSINLAIWTKSGRAIAREIGMEKYKTNNPDFDELFISNKKGVDSRVEAVLSPKLQQDIIELKKNTDRLDIHKRGSWLRMEYQVVSLESEAEVDKALQFFIEIYRAFTAV